MQFPHCDARILHAPGECEYCDMHADWQELRQTWGIAFTGHVPVTPSDQPWLKQLPCPADFNRPPDSSSDHRRWSGNKPTSTKGDPSWPRESFASQVLYGDQGGRAT